MKFNKTHLIALLATGSLLFSTSCNNTSAPSAKNTADSLTTSVAAKTEGAIAYVRMDSLMSGYGLYMDLGTEFGKKQEKVQKEIESKARSLENQIRDFQEKAQKGLITTYQAQTKQKELAEKEQQIINYRETKLRELAEQEAVISQQISSTILDYLTEYNAEKKYSMILQTMAGNPVIIADPALDITAEVLTELNKRYEATLESTEEKK